MMQKKEMKLLLAAKSNDFVNLSKILIKIDKAKTKRKSNSYIDVDVRNPDGITALHYAARYGNIEMMEELLSRGAYIDVIDRMGWRPLSYACANHKPEAVKKLIEWGSNVNMINEDNSPFHIAAAMGHVDIVKLLIEKGADIHYQNKKSQLPIDIACANHHYEVVNYLLSASSEKVEDATKIHFAEVKAKTGNPSRIRTVPLSAAKSTGNIASNVSFNLTPKWLDGSAQTQRYIKRCTSGSQELLMIPDRSSLNETVKAHPATKCESLNAIFVQEDESIPNQAPSRDIQNHFSKPIQLKPKISEPEKERQYRSSTSTFATSELFKIKSPLFPVNKNLPKDQQSIIIGKSVQSMNDSSFFRVKSVVDKKLLTESNDNCDSGKIFQLRNPPFKIKTTANKTMKSSSSLESPCNIEAHVSVQEPSLDILLSKVIQESIQSAPKCRKFKIYKENSNQIQNNSNDNYNNESIVTCSQQNSDTSSFYAWMESIGLKIILEILVNEGYDNFLTLSVATDEDLLILCHDETELFKILKNTLNSLNIPSVDQLVFSFDIAQILDQLGLEEYKSNFLRKGFSNIGQLPSINDKLFNQLDIVKMGHRKILSLCLEAQKKRHQQIINETLSTISILNPTPHVSRDIIRSSHISERSNQFASDQSRKFAPPLPPRSCSIPNDIFNDNYVVLNSLPEPQDEKTRDGIDKHTSDDFEGNLSNLDDIVAMLTSLGEELDNELNHSP